MLFTHFSLSLSLILSTATLGSTNWSKFNDFETACPLYSVWESKNQIFSVPNTHTQWHIYSEAWMVNAYRCHFMHGIAPLSFRLLSIRVLISIAQIVTLSSPNPFTLTPTEKKRTYSPWNEHKAHWKCSVLFASQQIFNTNYSLFLWFYFIDTILVVGLCARVDSKWKGCYIIIFRLNLV